MKSVGIICEYNPFHNGHLYHLNKVKEMFKDYYIILVLSGNFTERGDISIIDKWDKTSLALDYGVDLVIELPYSFCSESADTFSKGSISILNYLNVDYLVFGSEINDIDLFYKIADIQLNNNEYDSLVKEYMDKGINYPTALSNSLKKICNQSIDTPNDLLGLCYVREIIKTKSKIKPICIKRTNDFHSLDFNNNISSASSIREALKNNIDISSQVPYDYKKYIKNISFDTYFNLLKYKVITSDISNIGTVDEGLSYRIKKYITCSNNLEELINNIKTKRYTYNKINRMLSHILCNFTKEEASDKEIKYIRILGFNSKGKKYLNNVKKSINIPIISNYNEESKDLLSIENRVDNIYSIITKSELRKKPIIK